MSFSFCLMSTGLLTLAAMVEEEVAVPRFY